jgi:hypothetical protein
MVLNNAIFKNNNLVHLCCRFTLYDRAGKRREGEKILVDIGGPMCFQVIG